MGDKDFMPKLDIFNDKAKISQAQLDYMRILEQQNIERVAKLKRLRRNNLITGFCLVASVVSIYSYSFFAVKQEKFLDEIDSTVDQK